MDVPEDILMAASEALYDPRVAGPKMVTGPVLLRVAAALLAERERCAEVCEAQKQEFLSPQYASNQPFGSLTERFACDECAAAIRSPALSPSLKEQERT